MTYEELLTDLKNKIYKPVYFLYGEEPYYIDVITNYLQANVLTEEEKSFNLHVFYGKDADVRTVINTARRYPMMANYQVVILKEAQQLKEFDLLIHYLEKPLPSTILVINYKYASPDKRKKIFKLLTEKYTAFESAKVREEKIPEWIESYLKKKNYTIDSKAAVLLTEFLGNDLHKIINELEKLILLLPPDKKHITPALIEHNIGISKDYNNFELLRAVSQRDSYKATQIILYFAANQKNNPIVVTLSMLYNHFSRLLMYHALADKSRNNVIARLGIKPQAVYQYEISARNYPPQKTIRIIHWLREYDLKSKGIGNPSADEGALLKELIYKILH